MRDFLNPVKGFGVTFREMFKKVDTVMYPEEKRPTAPRFHGHHQLNRWPDGLEKCIGCELCAWACPADAIYVEGRDNTPDERFSPGERYGHVYQINYLRCILCGLCIEACPTRALTMTNEYEIADDEREKLIWTKEQLLAPLGEGMEAPPHPMVAGWDEKDYYRPGAPKPPEKNGKEMDAKLHKPGLVAAPKAGDDALPEQQDKYDRAEVERGLLLLALQAQAADPGISSWMKRRVEQLEFLDTRAVRWHVSIDFDVPKKAPTLLVGDEVFSLIPITTLPKGNLVAFDLRDERGTALWLPTSDETSRRVGPALVVMARRALQRRGSGLPASIAQAIMLIVETPPDDRRHEEAYRLFAAVGSRIDMERRATELREKSQQLYGDRFWCIRKRWRAVRNQGRALAEAMTRWRKVEKAIDSEDPNWDVAYQLMSDSTFRSLLEELAQNFVVHIGVASGCKTRRIVKITSERTVTFLAPKSIWRRVSQSLGWRCWPFDFFIGGSGGSHHLEVAAPAGVDIVRVTARPTPPGRWIDSAHRDEIEAPTLTSSGYSPHVHIHIPASSSFRYRATVYVRISRSEWLAPALLVAIIIAVVIVLGRLNLQYLFPDKADDSGEADTAATLLLALLAVIATWLIRPGEHPLASRLLSSVRALILLDVVALLICTGDLVLHLPARRLPDNLWTALAWGSISVAVVVTLSWLMPRRLPWRRE